MILLHHNLLLLQLLAHHFGSPFHVLAASLPPAASNSAQQPSNRALTGDSLNSDVVLARDGEAAVNLTTTTDTSPNSHHESNLIPRNNHFLEAAGQYYSKHYIERAAVVAGFFMGVKQLGSTLGTLVAECVAAGKDEKGKEKDGGTAKCVLGVLSQSLAIAATVTGGISAYRDVQRLLEFYRQLKTQQNGGAPVDIPLHPIKVRRDDNAAPGSTGGGLEIRHVGFWNDTVSSIVDAALRKRASSTNIDSSNDGGFDDEYPGSNTQVPVFASRSPQGVNFHFAILDHATTTALLPRDNNNMTMRFGFGSGSNGLEARDANAKYFNEGGIELKVER
ncbi:hypothetical protein QBC37DRAFT_431218 [Rhypophila decipiens]|uniref:Uncharacterized protein n=1 Tax=Rhypophila decipiens TaxID=261697 RepID=A0AAN7B3R3_9PEZI|nr:hypothetical protein QBC37DRAFT_431218 [Rhypophila decipiens]